MRDFSTATRLLPPAQGCRFGYPGKRKRMAVNRKAVAANASEKRDAYGWRNRVAVAESIVCFPRVAEAATLGWRRKTASRLGPTLTDGWATRKCFNCLRDKSL